MLLFILIVKLDTTLCQNEAALLTQNRSALILLSTSVYLPHANHPSLIEFRTGKNTGQQINCTPPPWWIHGYAENVNASDLLLAEVNSRNLLCDWYKIFRHCVHVFSVPILLIFFTCKTTSSDLQVNESGSELNRSASILKSQMECRRFCQQ